MPTHVALFRAINVGGNNMISMAGLRATFEEEGFGDVKTLLQSGNVVFTATSVTAGALEQKLEGTLAKKFGGETRVLVRDRPAWKKIIEANPFTAQAANDPGRLMIMCLRGAPRPDALTALKAAIVGREVFAPGPGCLYIHYPDGSGNSKFTNSLIERKLGVVGTARNWNTVQKIAALVA